MQAAAVLPIRVSAERPPNSSSCGTTTQNIGRATGFAGGGEFGHMFTIGPYAVAGWAVDLTGSTEDGIDSELDTARPD